MMVALSADCILFKTDIRQLFQLKDDKYAIMCVPRRLYAKEGTKMDGQEQHIYLVKIESVWYYGIVVSANRNCNKELVNDPKYRKVYAQI